MKRFFLFFIVFSNLIQAQTNSILNINNVAALFNNNGLNFRNQSSGNASYQVPKGSGKNSSYVSTLWIGGLDDGGQLHMAGQTYLQTGTDYFPGPVSNSTGYANMTLNKVWNITKLEIDEFKQWFANPSLYPLYTIPISILNWPGNGNVSYGQAAQLAPYVDVDNNGVYNPNLGDYPCIKGDEAVFYIINDDKLPHTETGGLKLGVEIHCMAYAFVSSNTHVHNAIFVDYKIYNRSANNYHNVYISTFDDFDVGGYNDDYIGCNISKNLYYAYNGDNNDSDYGLQVPAIGVTYLKSPNAPLNDGIDNDHDGILDEANEELSLSGAYYFKNNDPGVPLVMTDPSTAKQFYFYSQGLWRDSTHFKCGGNAYTGTVNTNYVFPGSSFSLSSCSSYWSEETAANVSGDRKMLGSCGPFNFPANSMVELELSYVWAQSSVSSNTLSVANLFLAADAVKNVYDTYIVNHSCASNNITSIKNNKDEIRLNVFPNPTSSLVSIDSYDVVENIEVLNELGENVNCKIESMKDIDVGNLNPGVYFLKLQTKSGIHYRRIVKI